jgi:hypothetical protein
MSICSTLLILLAAKSGKLVCDHNICQVVRGTLHNLLALPGRVTNQQMYFQRMDEVVVHLSHIDVCSSPVDVYKMK